MREQSSTRDNTNIDLSNPSDLFRYLRPLQASGNLPEFDIEFDERRTKVRSVYLRVLGDPSLARDLLAKLNDANTIATTIGRTPRQAYYFFSELRPGSGLIRFSGGREEGPGGTLTCFLSTADDSQRYFVAAGHVVSNFWSAEDTKPFEKQDPKKRTVAGPPNRPLVSSVYRYQKGFPATGSTRYLGKIEYLSPRPKLAGTGPRKAEDENGIDERVDIAIIKLRDDVEPTQRTTCYGSFNAEDLGTVEVGQQVMKCGAEEPHLTYAVVENACVTVSLYGPQGTLYELEDQVILSLDAADGLRPASTRPPKKWTSRQNRREPDIFATPGDSGAMVVDRHTRKPLGMLIGGSILDGRYVMTPIRFLQQWWGREGLKLVFRRA